MLRARSLSTAAKNSPRHVVLEQTRAVLAEARGVEGRVGDVEVEEPLEQQVVLQPLAELALGAHGDTRAMSREALSRCSGGIEGLPRREYIWLSVGEIACKARPTIGLIARMDARPV